MNATAAIVGRAARVHDSTGDRVEFQVTRGLKNGRLDTVRLDEAETLALMRDLARALASMRGVS